MDSRTSEAKETQGVPRPLSLRLAGYAIFVGLLLGLILSGGQLALDLLEERQRIDITLRQVVNTVREPAVRAAYEIDDDLARSIVSGLFQFEPIRRVEVVDDYGTVLAEGDRPPLRGRMEWLVRWTFGGLRHFDIPLQTVEGERPVGHISVTADSRPFAVTFFRRAKVALISDVIRNGILAAILALIFYYSIARPLRRMAWQVSKVDPAVPAVRPVTIPRRNASDELGLLADSINRLLEASEANLSTRREAEERLRRHNEYMAALHETALGLISRLDLGELFQTLINRAARLARATDGFLYIYNAESDRLEVKAGYGALTDLIGFQIAPGEGMCGRVWQSGEPMSVEDYRHWPHRIDVPAFHGMRAVVTLPIPSRPHLPGGVLGLTKGDPRDRFDEADIDIMERFAELASVALENARLYTRLQEELAERQRAEQERERMEAQFLHSQKMEAIGALAGGIAHDFNNILVPIIGFAELGIRCLPQGAEETREHLGEILNAADRARDLVRQILTFSRKSNGEQKPLLVQPIIKETVKLLKSTLPATIRVEETLDPHCCHAAIIPSQIHQVIMNLCTNAYHAMRETGGVLSIDLAEWDGERPPALPPGRYLRISVSDTGHGMDAATCRHIFEPYFTTKPAGEGTGMGLSVVYGVVKGHGGEVTVQSEPGEGTTVRVYLPAVSPEEMTEEPDEPRLPAGSESVLLVEDDPLVARAEKSMLSVLGYRVTVETDSRAALDRIRGNPGEFDLVITDMTMPCMTGVDLAREIDAMDPGLPVILCSGFSEKVALDQPLPAGICQRLAKPVTISDLARAVRRALGEGQMRQAGKPAGEPARGGSLPAPRKGS
jgi:signal transduction histidine kinase/ActR/RegA family two-component response regulator